MGVAPHTLQVTWVSQCQFQQHNRNHYWAGHSVCGDDIIGDAIKKQSDGCNRISHQQRAISSQGSGFFLWVYIFSILVYIIFIIFS